MIEDFKYICVSNINIFILGLCLTFKFVPVVMNLDTKVTNSFTFLETIFLRRKNSTNLPEIMKGF